MDGVMRIVFISDTHNQLNSINIPPGDILIHCGDATIEGSPKEIMEFARCMRKLPHPHKIFLPGNHDLLFESDFNFAARLLENSCKVLLDSSISVNGLKIFASPWSPQFFNWAFNLERGEPLAQKWKGIPPDVDILITHSPPRGILDKNSAGGSIGCDDLLERVLTVKPQIHAFGHLHESHGFLQKEETLFINCSILKPSGGLNEPIVREIKTE